MNVWDAGLSGAGATLIARIRSGPHAGKWVSNVREGSPQRPVIWSLSNDIYASELGTETLDSQRFPYGYDVLDEPITPV